MDLEVVVAVDSARGIGREGELPWRIPADMAHFRALTQAAPPGQTNAVIMGRATWDSIPPRFRPLADRRNIVLSRTVPAQKHADRIVVPDLDHAIAAAHGCHRVFVIGGGQVYAEALDRPECVTLHITRVDGEYQADVQFPVWDDRFLLDGVVEEGQSGEHRYRIERWRRS